MNKTFQEQNDELLMSYIDKHLKTRIRGKMGLEVPHIEFIVTPNCDLKCEYCYINRHKDLLYPKDIRDNTTILHNAEIMLDYLESNYQLVNLELFSGELFSQNVGYDIIELILSKVTDKRVFISNIIIPTNMSFISDDNRRHKVGQYIEKFKELGIGLKLSASIDGKMLEESRPFATGLNLRDDTFYDNLFEFGSKYRIGWHPMVSAYNIEKWSSNYDWYVENLEKVLGDNTSKFHIMMLEVRNDDWTDDKIKSYLKFLDHIIVKKLQWHNNDPIKLANYIINDKLSYNNIAIKSFDGDSDKITCSIQNSIQVRLGDLAIAFCHRTSYEQFIAGKFRVENDKIVGIDSENESLYFTMKALLSGNQPRCSKCQIRNICPKGCLGSQFETTGDLFSPIKSVCNMYKAKNIFLVNRYNQMGILDHVTRNLPEDTNRTIRSLIDPNWINPNSECEYNG